MKIHKHARKMFYAYNKVWREKINDYEYVDSDNEFRFQECETDDLLAPRFSSPQNRVS